MPCQTSFFYDATTYLYKRSCPSVVPSVGPSVRISRVISERGIWPFFRVKGRQWHYNQCYNKWWWSGRIWGKSNVHVFSFSFKSIGTAGFAATNTNSNFLDAISHFFKRVFPSVRPSVRRSVRLSVGRSHMSWISNKWAEFEQHSIRNMRICHKKDDSKTSTRAVRQNASVVQTLFDLLADMLLNFLIMIFLQVETWEFCCSGN